MTNPNPADADAALAAAVKAADDCDHTDTATCEHLHIAENQARIAAADAYLQAHAARPPQ